MRAGTEFGHGLVRIRLPDCWQSIPQNPFHSCVFSPEGRCFHALANSFEDPEAARGGERLADYVYDEGVDGPSMEPAEILGDVIGYAREPRSAEPGVLIWKSFETFERRFLREFRLETAIDQNFSAQILEHLGAYGADLMCGLTFADHLTPIDLVAPSATWRRLDADDAFAIRVPANWQDEWEDDGDFHAYAVEAPDDSATLWISHLRVGETKKAIKPGEFRVFFEAFADTWISKHTELSEERRDYLSGLDAVLKAQRFGEPDPSGSLRRTSWIRAKAEGCAISQIIVHLCVNEDCLKSPDYWDVANDIDREVRNALLDPEMAVRANIRMAK